MRTSFVIAAMLLAMSASAVLAQSYQIQSIQVDHPWTRATPKGAKTAVAYLRITNSGKTTDRLVGGSSSVAAEFTLHEMTFVDGVMKMRPLPNGVELKPGETVELKPGSFHGMFVGLKQPLKQGESIKGMLRFEKAGAIEVEYAVESIGAQQPANSGAAEEANTIDPLIAWRAVHFASTVMVFGGIIFAFVIAKPALCAISAPAAMRFRTRTAWILYINLAIAGVSGAAWLLLLAGRIANRPLSDVLSDNTAWVVLTQTQFGLAWQLRLLCAVLLAGFFPLFDLSKGRTTTTLAAVAIATPFIGALAWTGHGGAMPGTQGFVLLFADFVHLVAAGAWLGGLPPLALMLAQLRRADTNSSAAMIYRVTRRFSEIGIVTVAALLASGLVNTWFMAGSVDALVDTDYGRLLLIKIGLFTAMVSLAVTNRLWLLPRLSNRPERAHVDINAVRRLQQNIIAEIVFGLAVIAIIAALGVMVPAAHVTSHYH